MTDSLDRIHASGLLGGDVTEENANEHADEEGDIDGPEGNGTGHSEHGNDEGARSPADKDAQQSAGDADEDRLDKELEGDDGTGGAYGHAETDLLGALRDGDEHNVHDADSGHEQGEGGGHDEDNGDGVHRTGHGFHHLCLRTDLEVIGCVILELVVVAEYLGEFLDGCIGEFLGDGGTDNAGEIGLGGDALHDGRVGRDNDVVLVHSPGVVALRLEHAADAHGDGLEADGLAYGIVTAKEFRDDGLSHHADLGGFLDIFLGEAFAFLDVPLLDVEIVGGLSVHRGGGIVVAVDGLSAGRNLRRYLGDEFLFLEDALVVCHLERLHAGGILTHTATHICTGTDGEQVGAHRGEFGAYAFLGALSDGHHDDDGSNADDDAEHGEEGAHLVVCYGLQTYFE